ncbi:MAG: URC4/urg3 family protein [Rubrivivax sp.]
MPDPTAFTDLAPLAADGPVRSIRPSRAEGGSADRDAMAEAVRVLRLPATIRERCGAITAAVADGRSAHFTLERARLGEVVKRVVAATELRYPGGKLPLHSRWRHFEAGGVDRLGQLDKRLAGLDDAARARARIDLAVVSVLLDAGAGSEWQYLEGGAARRFVRSEGLAVASFNAFISGAFSSDPQDPLRVDASALERMTTAQLAAMFQVAQGNPLVGLEGRVMLMQRLGAALRKRADVFGEPGRPGRLFDLLGQAPVTGPDGGVVRVPVRKLRAGHILRALLKAFGGIWPSGQTLGGKAIGDVWAHPLAGGSGPSAGRVPFHKLSQWLAYSLVEPFQWAGIAVDGLEELTGLPEYRNGGLFIDAGVLLPRNPAYGAHLYTPADAFVVEWRALTVTLLDEVARGVRSAIGQPLLPLAAVLEGGTWAAGRQIASERRPGGPPPVKVASNGTLF